MPLKMSAKKKNRTILVDAETAFEIFSLNHDKRRKNYRQGADFFGIAKTLKEVKDEKGDKIDVIFIVQDKLNEGDIDVRFFNMKEKALERYFGNAQQIVSNWGDFRLRPERYEHLLDSMGITKKRALFITNSVMCGDAAKQSGIGTVCNFSQCNNTKNPHENMLGTIKKFAGMSA